MTCAIGITVAALSVLYIGQVTGAVFICPTLFDFYPDPEDCAKFYRCFWGAAYPFHCPTGTKWNHKVLTCDFAFNVDCDGSTNIADHESGMKHDLKEPTNDIDFDYNGDHEYGKESHPWDHGSYDVYDDVDHEQTDSKGGDELNIPTHNRQQPAIDQPKDGTATSSPSGDYQIPDERTKPDGTLIDYLYPDYKSDGHWPVGEYEQGSKVDDDRSDVTHDYAWYEGKDYNNDYVYEDNRNLDYRYDYNTDYDYAKKDNDRDDKKTNDSKKKGDVSTDDVSYFQDGYPSYRHYYEPTDFLSPQYARHNGPVGKRR